MADKKRKAPATVQRKSHEHNVKRQRRGGRVHLFDLSDEILLRTLSFLDVHDLMTCEKTCSKLRGLASDNGLWRERYYQHFIRPRTRRLPRLRIKADGFNPKDQPTRGPSISRSTRLERPPNTGTALDDWKQIFKIKHNWTRGRATRSELSLLDDPRQPVQAKVHNGKLYTADREHGVRVWKAGVVICECALNHACAPTALAIEDEDGFVHISVADTAANVTMFRYSQKEEKLLSIAHCRTSSGQPATNVALSWPYLMAIDTMQNVNLHHFKPHSRGYHAHSLTSLHSDAILSPVALSLRKVKGELVAGIAYTFSSLHEGWCLGLQEVRMPLDDSHSSEICRSSADLEATSTFAACAPPFTTRFATSSAFALHPDLRRVPSSVSYCGCYVMVGLPDNTLMVYLVKSTDEILKIDPGRRLWGHTSAISATEVTPTGKAVSISAYGDEMRYWELEEVLSSCSQSRSSTSIESVRRTDSTFLTRGNGLGLALKEVKKESKIYRHGVSFDHEQAIVVGRSDQGQVISCFHFS